MKKTKLFRLLFIVTVVATILAASAVVASANAATEPITDDAAYKYSKVLDDAVKISFTQDLFTNPIANGYVYCRVEALEGYDLLSAVFVPPDPSRNNDQKWEQKGKVKYGIVTCTDLNNLFFAAGTYDLEVKYGTFDFIKRIDFYFASSFKAPKEMKITTYPDKICFNSEYVWQSLSGEYTIVESNGRRVAILNGKTNTVVKGFEFKPGKKYDMKMYGTDLFQNQQIYGPAYTAKNVIMGPKTTPVIKSVKVSNVKVSKYFDYKEWKYRYKTKYKITVNLSKKAANTKGIYLTAAGTSGFTGEYKKVKGTGKTFTTTITKDAPKSQKGKKIKVSVRTYSDNKYKAYSNESKSKTVTIR